MSAEPVTDDDYILWFGGIPEASPTRKNATAARYGGRFHTAKAETMMQEPFTKAEAEEKIGRTVKTLTDYSGVPKGATGKVSHTDKTTDGWLVGIDWQLAARHFGTEPRPLRDWFTRSEYNEYLIEE